MYKEGKCATTHIHRFINALALNGETDELIKIALFGNSLTDANNYNWFTTQRTTYPYQDFQELLTAFKLRYQEVDNDDQAYLKFRSLKQKAKELVDDYYERMMKLANQFATIPSDNFLMSNFRAGLLKYLQVATVGLPRTTLAQARKSAKTAESSLPKDEVSSISTTKHDRPPVKKCTLCGKHHHEAKDCWMNPESEIGKQRAAQGKTTTVAVTTPTTTPTGPRKYPPKGEPRRIHPCSICQEEHLTYRCPLLKDPTVCAYLKQRKKENQHKTPTSTVEITDVTTAAVGVLPLRPVTRSQTLLPTKQSIPTALDTDWVAQERLQDQMMREVRQLQNKLEGPTPAPSVAPSGDSTPLEWDPKALPQHDNFVSDTQPNHTTETPKTTELSHRVLESIQNHKLQVTMRDLFSLSRSLTEFVRSRLTEVVTPPSRTPTTKELIIATEAIDKHMPVISICIGKNIVDYALLDDGSEVNVITEEERRRLGLPKPSPSPFNLKMANRTIAKPTGLLRDVKIHIHGIPYIVTLTVIDCQTIKSDYSMLLGRPWLRNAKVIHDWANDQVQIMGNGTVKTMKINCQLGYEAVIPHALVFYNFAEGITEPYSWQPTLPYNQREPLIGMSCHLSYQHQLMTRQTLLTDCFSTPLALYRWTKPRLGKR